MNIFVLDEDVELSARYHCDSHIVKMPLETAQLLSTARLESGCSSYVSYTATHVNHPCSVWARESMDNYLWLCNLGVELCREFQYRYGKVHGCQRIISECIDDPANIPSNGMTPFALAMPNEYKTDDAVESYRNYYNAEKRHLFKWKNREMPQWIQSIERV